MDALTTGDELSTLDATAQAALVQSGDVSALELVDAAIARLTRDNPLLNAVVRTDFERARERAARVDGSAAAPFAGVPMLLKDVGAEQAGDLIHMGSRVLQNAGHRAARDSYLLQKLLGAGFIPLGRTNMPELAILATTESDAYGPARNPWNLEHSPGGSSGGAAAAVAAGIVPVAHGSDGGGSIRGPASVCNLVGLKPSRGRCSFGPDLGERWSSLSAEFMLTRSVRDCAALLDALAGPMPGDPYHAPPPARPFASALSDAPPRLRIGVLAHGPRGIELMQQNAQAVRGMAQTLETLGHTVEEAYPHALDEPETPLLWVQIVAANVASSLERIGELIGRAVSRDDVEPLTFALAEMGRSVTAVQYVHAIQRMHAFGRRVCDFFDGGFDLLLTPTQGAPPPRLGYLGSSPEEPLRPLLRAAPFGVFTLPFNMSGQPAISLPAAFADGDLPIGVQLVAAYGREDLLLQVAAQIEHARPWADRLPAALARARGESDAGATT
jgi:amidase